MNRPNVRYYFVRDGHVWCASHDGQVTVMGSYFYNYKNNPLYRDDENRYCYTIPVGFTYELGICYVDDSYYGGFYVYCVQGDEMPHVVLDERGDVDGNGELTIADVTALIDYILYPDTTSVNLDNADCDKDGVIGIADVVALIDYILMKSW